MPSGPLAERTRREIIRLCHAGLDVRGLRAAVLQRLRLVMPIDAVFFATLDPATLLFTDAMVDDVLQEASPRLLDNEFLGGDVNRFVLIARSRTPVRTLVQATGRRLERSPRYRDILAPLALGDELRAVLRTGSLCWGCLCLHRERGTSGFTAAEARYVASLTAHLAAGLRTALLASKLADAGGATGPGLLVLGEDLSVVASTPMAQQWLADLKVQTSPLGDLPSACMQSPPGYEVSSTVMILHPT